MILDCCVSGNVFERPLAQEWFDSLSWSSTIRRIGNPLLRDWDVKFPRLQGERVERKENCWIRRLNHLTSKEVECWMILVEPVLIMVWWVIRESLFRSTSELRFSTNNRSSDHPAPLDQRNWGCKINWRTFDIAVDYKATWFLDFDILDAMIASVLKKLLITQSNSWKGASVEEQRDQKLDRFLRRKQLSFMIYEYSRATGAFQAVQGLSTLSAILQNDDVQDSTSDVIILMVRYTFIQIAKTLSSKNTFIQKHFHPKEKTISSTTFSSQNGFIQWHFHPKTVSSNDTFIPNHFHPTLNPKHLNPKHLNT